MEVKKSVKMCTGVKKEWNNNLMFRWCRRRCCWWYWCYFDSLLLPLLIHFPWIWFSIDGFVFQFSISTVFFLYFINKTIIVLFYWYLCAFVAIRWKQYINNDINECEKKPTKLRLKYTVWHPVIRSSHTRSAHTIKKSSAQNSHWMLYIGKGDRQNRYTGNTRNKKKIYTLNVCTRVSHTCWYSTKLRIVLEFELKWPISMKIRQWRRYRDKQKQRQHDHQANACMCCANASL